MSSTKKGRATIIVAAVLWSTSGFFAKAPLFDAWPIDVRGTMLAFWRAFFAGCFLLPFSKQITWTKKLVPATLIFAVMNITFLTAMTKTTAANSIWLQSTYPIWVFLIGIVFFSEQIKRADWMMLAFAGVGVGVIVVCELSSSLVTQRSREGVLWGLCSGVSLAFVVTSLRILRNLNSIWLISVYHLVTATLLFPFVAYHQTWPNIQQVFLLAIFGVFQMGLPYVLVARALRDIPSHEAAFLLLLEPVLVPLWVWLAWRHHPLYEAPRVWTFIGAGLILLGLVCRYGMARKTQQ